MAYRYDVRKGVERIKTKTFIAISALGLVLLGGGMSVANFTAAHAITPPAWNVSGNWVFDYYYGGSNLHDMTLSQDGTGALSGSGGAYSGSLPYAYPWTIVSGSVSGNAINLTADLDNLNCFFTLVGTIAPSGTMSGTWTDDCAGSRNGTWTTTVGSAAQIATAKDQCKKDGWKTLVDNNGNRFKNQGDCVSFVATGWRNPANG